MPFYSFENSLGLTPISFGENVFLWKKKAVFTINKLHWNNLFSVQGKVESVLGRLRAAGTGRLTFK